MPVQPQSYVPIAVVCLVVWRVYARMRRNIGRQRLRKGRLIYSIVVYSLLTLGSAAVALLLGKNLGVAGGLAAGLAIGGGVSLYALRLTRFESTPEGQFYTPHPYIGVGLSVLLMGRLVYRLSVLSAAPARVEGQPSPPVLSPLTFFIYGLFAGYYIVYFTGVLMRCKQSVPAPAGIVSAPPAINPSPSHIDPPPVA